MGYRMSAPGMPVVVAGSRSIFDYGLLKEVVETAQREMGIRIDTVICGCAVGVDRMMSHSRGGLISTEVPGADGGYGGLALELGLPVLHHPVSTDDWYKYGTHGPDNAAYRRNHRMAHVCRAGIVIVRGRSGGSENMLRQLRLHGRPCYVRRLD